MLPTLQFRYPVPVKEQKLVGMKSRKTPEASKHPGAERRAAFHILQDSISKKQETPIASRALGTAEPFDPV